MKNDSLSRNQLFYLAEYECAHKDAMARADHNNVRCAFTRMLDAFEVKAIDPKQIVEDTKALMAKHLAFVEQERRPGVRIFVAP